MSIVWHWPQIVALIWMVASVTSHVIRAFHERPSGYVLVGSSIGSFIFFAPFCYVLHAGGFW